MYFSFKFKDSEIKISYFVIILPFILTILLSTLLTIDDGKKAKGQCRLGFMPNVTHATALVGIQKKIFQEELGKEVDFKPVHFVVGNSIIDAFITNQIDVAYVGPGPYINALYRKLPIKLLSNAANGGTVIVGVKSPSEGTRVSVPQYGNTQDLILRNYLFKNNLTKQYKILAIPPQDTATAFFTMSIDLACLPEPWGTILTEKGACKMLVDEKEVLNNGNYPVTILVVNEKYAKDNPEHIKKILAAHNRANELIKANSDEAIKIVTDAISKITKKQIDKTIVAKSFKRCFFTNALDQNSLEEFKSIGIKAGYYKKGF